MFTIEAFAYDSEKDLYTCPAGETLRRRGHDHRGGYVRYAAHASACNGCVLKSRCTKGPKERWVSRSLEEEYLERVRAYRGTEAYAKALRKRAVWIEPLFGEAKEWHGSRRFRLRGLEKVNSEALMIASGQTSSGSWPSGRRRSEEGGVGGGPPRARSRPSEVSWCPKASQRVHSDPSGTFFNRLTSSTHSGE